MNDRFFRIGEVSEATDVPAHVLRYWESEFGDLRPAKGGGGQRLYRERDIELVRRIKHLLYEQRFTVEGARRALKQGPTALPPGQRLGAWIDELEQIHELLTAAEPA